MSVESSKAYIFGPLLMKFQLDDNVVKTMQKDLIEDNVAVVDYRRQLAGAINYEKQIPEQKVVEYADYLHPYIKHWIDYLISSHSPQMKPAPADLIFRNMWVNKQVAGEYNPLHWHGGGISFVVYVDVPEVISQEEQIQNYSPPGSIQFVDGCDDASRLYHNDCIGPNDLMAAIQPVRSLNIRPCTGELLVFPSYLQHQVNHFRTTGIERVSMSGNIQVYNPEKGKPV